MNKFEYYLILSEDRTKIISLGCVIDLNLYTAKNYLSYTEKSASDTLAKIKQISKGKDPFYSKKEHISFAKKQLELKPTVVKVEIKI